VQRLKNPGHAYISHPLKNSVSTAKAPGPVSHQSAKGSSTTVTCVHVKHVKHDQHDGKVRQHFKTITAAKRNTGPMDGGFSA